MIQKKQLFFSIFSKFDQNRDNFLHFFVRRVLLVIDGTVAAMEVNPSKWTLSS